MLTQAELDYFVDAAIARWSEAGLTEEQLDALEAMSFGVADMSGLNLGSFSPTQITLDADAAGRGWYLDGTPLDDSEFGSVFSATWLQTDPTGAPAGHYDLLTTVMHEMGHALGLGDSYASGDRDELMYGWLYTGERRLPGADDADGAVAGSITSEEFLGAPLDIGVLPFGKSVTIQWQATINAQNNQLIVNPSNQGTVAATNAVGFPDKLTDDPAVGGANDPTVTTLDTLSLGNLVFNDVNKDGLFNAGDSGVNGVTLSLFVDANNDNVIDNEAAPLATTTTAGGGLYSFAGLAPGNYIVRVDLANFQAGGALERAEPARLLDRQRRSRRQCRQRRQRLAGAGRRGLLADHHARLQHRADGRHRQRHQQHARLRLHLQHAADRRQCRAVHRRRGRDLAGAHRHHA